MKELVVLSGKGGTGKTSVVGAIADLAATERRLVLADADVDAANLEIIVSPEVIETHQFVGGNVAQIDPDLCTGCGLCAETCRFEAILEDGGLYSVDQVGCEGCAACFYVCPAGAIQMEERVSGEWYRSESPLGPLFHARLSPGQENSGKLVIQVKMSARAAAGRAKADLLLVDGPPGIGCPAIAATGGANLALLVAEPSVSGVHDLERILATTRHFGVPAAVCVNKADINPTRTAEIERMCRSEEVPLLAQIPFDRAVVETLVRREPVTRRPDSPAAMAIKGLWRELRQWLE